MNIDELFDKYKTEYTYLDEEVILIGDFVTKEKFLQAIAEIISSPVEPEVIKKNADGQENILLSELIRHLRTDFEDGEVISYRIKVKQPFSKREIRYPSK